MRGLLAVYGGKCTCVSYTSYSYVKPPVSLTTAHDVVYDIAQLLLLLIAGTYMRMGLGLGI